MNAEIASKCTESSLQKSVESANGMLPFPVYTELWNAARGCRGTSFVEVGTAHGAATIAMTWGALSAGRSPTVHSIDTLSGIYSSRSRYGSVSQNKAIIDANFEAAGIAQNVSLFVGSTDEFMMSGSCPEQIDLLMLDADGRIDRDLIHFFPKMTDGALVIIDDVDSKVYLGQAADGRPYVDLKHRITRLLLDALVVEGFLDLGKVVHATAFCTKGRRNPGDAARIAEVALPCYRALVFTSLTGRFWQSVLTAWLLRNAALNKVRGPLVAVARSLRLTRRKARVCAGVERR